jgi:4-hydroxy-3-methylbut-2-enyl diphosphate reductase
VQEIVESFQRLNPALELVEEGEWEDIEFRPARRVPAPAR